MEPNNTPLRPDDGDHLDRDCPQCGARSVTTYWYHDTFTYGSGHSAVELRADVPVRRCGMCHLEFLDHEGQQRRHEAVCRHLGVLSPTDILAIRKAYQMTRAAFAEVSGLGEATLNRWENGAVVQNLANDRYLRLLAIPEVMAILRTLTAAPSFPTNEDAPATVIQFRALEVSPEHRRDQANFELRRVS